LNLRCGEVTGAIISEAELSESIKNIIDWLDL
jgi:hypothetical protein